jgi:hypothetical protein
MFAVIDGVEGKEYDDFSGLGYDIVFSPDSKRAAYEVRGSLLVVDDKEYFQASEPAFGPDSKYVAYIAAKKGKLSIVVDGVECKDKQYDTRLGRLLFDSPTKLHTLMLRDGEIFLVEIEIT